MARQKDERIPPIDSDQREFRFGRSLGVPDLERAVADILPECIDMRTGSMHNCCMVFKTGLPGGSDLCLVFYAPDRARNEDDSFYGAGIYECDRQANTLREASFASLVYECEMAIALSDTPRVARAQIQKLLDMPGLPEMTPEQQQAFGRDLEARQERLKAIREFGELPPLPLPEMVTDSKFWQSADCVREHETAAYDGVPVGGLDMGLCITVLSIDRNWREEMGTPPLAAYHAFGGLHSGWSYPKIREELDRLDEMMDGRPGLEYQLWGGKIACNSLQQILVHAMVDTGRRLTSINTGKEHGVTSIAAEPVRGAHPLEVKYYCKRRD